MILWQAYMAAAIIGLTTAVIYPIDVLTANGEPRWVHLSGLLNGGCSDSVGEAVAAGIGNFGYGFAIWYFVESMRRVFWVDGERVKYLVGLAGAASLYLVLGFPTGRGFGTDVVHHSAMGLAIVLITGYAIASLDARNRPAAIVQNLSALAMIASGFSLLATYLAGELDKKGWNGFVASQLAYGISFLLFLVAWGTLRTGPDRRVKLDL